jgi:sporulation protein YlmC with PRC-barrel domain
VPADEQSAGRPPVPHVTSTGGEPLRIGAKVLAIDGECGKLVRVIVDPGPQAVTHLVVAPKHHSGLDRLVPIDLLDAADEHEIRLRCDVKRFGELDDAEDAEFLPGNADLIGYGGHGSLSGYVHGSDPLLGSGRTPMYTDRVPRGEVEVRPGQAVHATDGMVGKVGGLVIDPADEHVTHILLEEGHLWGHKQVAIPIGAAARVGELGRVELTKQQIEDLPAVELTG